MRKNPFIDERSEIAPCAHIYMRCTGMIERVRKRRTEGSRCLIPRGLPRKAAVGGGCRADFFKVSPAVLIPFISFLTGLALIVAVFSGCNSDADPAKGVKSTEAELKSLSVGDIEAQIPTAITGAMWDDTAQTLNGLAAEYTKTIEFSAGTNMSNLTVTTEISKNAKVEFATSAQPNTRPTAFRATDKPVTLSPPLYLYIRVTAEDDSYRSYYRFYITQEFAPVTGITFDEESAYLTIGYRGKLAYTITPPYATNKNVTWSSSDTDVVSVDEDGTVTALSYTSGGSSTDSAEATGTAAITATTADGGFSDTITVIATMEALVDMMDLPPLKDQFDAYFIFGNIFDPSSPWSAGDISVEEPYVVTNERLLRHYNVLTPQNNMKPSYLSAATRGTYNEANIATADRMINAARTSGFKVVGHTLLWHSQNSTWMNNLRSSNDSAADVLTWMKEYITYIVDRYKGKIYSWDVLNEAFPDGVSATANWRNSMRNGASDGNPWFMKIGADFVYEGFLAARLADPDAILYYNDYNLDSTGKATMVRNMVRDVNAQYRAAYPNETRLLIEGIGMQSHHNIGVTANSIKATLDLFRPLNVRISISELDVLSQTYSDHSNQTNPPNTGKLQAANLYGQYFKVFLDNADIIERVSFWGIVDNRSWRSVSLPLIFDANGKAKPAYYRIIRALEEFEAGQQ